MSTMWSYRQRGKRLVDLLAACVAIVLLSPLMVATAILVRAKLGSPVLFSQLRPGRNGRPFRLYKFRTMTSACDKAGRLLPDADRLTQFGKWLRTTSLDELPELWNILRGDMSLVGPRPLLMEYLPLYSPEQARRHDVRPGLTGWAQVNGRNAIAWEKKFQLDSWYVDNLSPWLDFKILWRTAREVIRMDGVAKQGFATTDLFTAAPNRRPRIGFAGDRDIAVRVLDHLLAQGDQPEVLLVAGPERATHADALVDRCRHLPDTHILRGKSFREPESVALMRQLGLDYIVSIHFPYVYPPELMDAARGGILNLHPSYLPFGRGWHTPSWAILDGCPFGATLHVIDEGIDTGDILHQLPVEIEPHDTAHTLYQRVKDLEFDVFCEGWQRLKEGLIERRSQNRDGLARKRQDLLSPEIQCIDLDAPTTARELLQRLRALTTNQLDEAAYFEEAGNRYRVRVEFSAPTNNEIHPPAPVMPESIRIRMGQRLPSSDPRKIYLSPPHMSHHERQLMLEAFDSNWIAPLGPHVDAFEREFAEKVGASHAVALSSGTAALHLALLAAGVGPGDVVLTSTLTFAATANAIRYVGAEPVFIDSERRSWNMDPQLLEDELRDRSLRGSRPKAVLVVDVCGQSADWEPILDICRRYGVTPIEDAAEALGATYRGRPAGTLSDIGCFSFNGNKIITTSGGGMLVTENARWAERVRYLATQARDPSLHYQHSAVGFNYRLSNLLAAVGRGQLSALDDRVARRRANFDFYQETLGGWPGIEFMPEASFGRATRWLTCLLIDPQTYRLSPSDVCAALAAEEIEARPMWKPMHQQPVFAGSPIRSTGVADGLFRQGLCLPSGSSMRHEDLQRVAASLRTILNANASRKSA